MKQFHLIQSFETPSFLRRTCMNYCMLIIRVDRGKKIPAVSPLQHVSVVSAFLVGRTINRGARVESAAGFAVDTRELLFAIEFSRAVRNGRDCRREKCNPDSNRV